MSVRATPSGQPALVASPSSPQAVSTEGFDQAHLSDRAIALLHRILADCERRDRVYGEAAIGLSGDVRHEAQILIAEHRSASMPGVLQGAIE